jgi:predicted transcriptional regulator
MTETEKNKLEGKLELLKGLNTWIVEKWSDPGKLISCREVCHKIDHLILRHQSELIYSNTPKNIKPQNNMTQDEVTITIEITRNVNGTVEIKHKVKGRGIRLYEMIGALQISSYQLAQKSIETAPTLPDEPVSIHYGNPNNKTNE